MPQVLVSGSWVQRAIFIPEAALTPPTPVPHVALQVTEILESFFLIECKGDTPRC